MHSPLHQPSHKIEGICHEILNWCLNICNKIEEFYRFYNICPQLIHRENLTGEFYFISDMKESLANASPVNYKAITSSAAVSSGFYQPFDDNFNGKLSSLNLQHPVQKGVGMKSSKHVRRRTNSRNRRSNPLVPRVNKRRSTRLRSFDGRINDGDVYFETFSNNHQFKHDKTSMIGNAPEKNLYHSDSRGAAPLRSNNKRRDIYDTDFYNWGKYSDQRASSSSSPTSSFYEPDFAKRRLGFLETIAERKFDHSGRGGGGVGKNVLSQKLRLKWVSVPPRKLVISNSTGGVLNCLADGEGSRPRISWTFEDGRPVRNVSFIRTLLITRTKFHC